MNIRDKIIETLETYSTVLRLMEDDFFIIGAASMILSGAKIVHTADIDILTTSRDAIIMESALKPYIKADYRPRNGKRFRSRFSRYHLKPLDMEIMGDLEVKSEQGWERLQIMEWNEVALSQLIIKIPTVTEQIRILRAFGRPKDFARVKLLRNLS